MKIKKTVTSLLCLALLACGCMSVWAEDNETDKMPLKEEVELVLDYENSYDNGDDFEVPTSAKMNKVSNPAGNFSIDDDDVDILYEGTDSTYSSSSFPRVAGNYRVTWTVKESSFDYYGSGSATFGLTGNAKYFITYVLNGGKNSDNNKDFYQVSDSDQTLESGSKKGNLFRGWFLDDKLTDRLTDDKITAGKAEDLTLYAKWIKLGDVDASGGDISVTDLALLKDYLLSKVSGSKLDLEACDLDKNGSIGITDRAIQKDIILGKINLEADE